MFGPGCNSSSCHFSRLFWCSPFVFRQVVGAIWIQDTADMALEAPGRMPSPPVSAASLGPTLSLRCRPLLTRVLVRLHRLAGRQLSLRDMALRSLHCFEYHGFSKGTEMHQRLSNTREEVAFLTRIGFARGLPTAVSPLPLLLAASPPLLFLCPSSAPVKQTALQSPFSRCASSLWWFSYAAGSSTGSLPESARGSSASAASSLQRMHLLPLHWVTCPPERMCRMGRRLPALSLLPPTGRQKQSAQPFPPRTWGFHLVHTRLSFSDTSICISNPGRERTTGFSAALF